MRSNGVTVHGVLKHDSSVPASEVVIVQGSFTGNSTNNRAIPHGTGLIPKMVHVIPRAANVAICTIVLAINRSVHSSADEASACTTADATNFYTGGGVNFNGNYTGVVYDWVVVG